MSCEYLRTFHDRYSFGQLFEAPNVEGYIGEGFWEDVFEKVDDPDEMRSYLRMMEKMGEADITWNDEDVPEKVWLRGY